MLRSLECLEKHLSLSKTLSGEDVPGAADVIVGYPLMFLPQPVIDKHSTIKTWLETVNNATIKYSSRLIKQAQATKKNDNKVKSKKINNEAKQQDSKTPGDNRKLRILCIHGYRQSAKTSKEKLGSFR